MRLTRVGVVSTKCVGSDIPNVNACCVAQNGCFKGIKTGRPTAQKQVLDTYAEEQASLKPRSKIITWNRKGAIMKNVSKLSEKALKQLDNGAFLVCNTAGGVNVMTIGWGSTGIMWSRPVFTAPVRLSRLTHDLMEEGSEFAVCFPKKGTLSKELAFCGTKSGRDVDKIAETGMTLEKAKTISVPVIKGSAVVFECRTLAKTTLSEESFIDAGIVPWTYSNNDFHTLYIGEIVEAYER